MRSKAKRKGGGGVGVGAKKDPPFKNDRTQRDLDLSILQKITKRRGEENKREEARQTGEGGTKRWANE